MMLLSRVVEYMRSSGVPFRLESYPSPESAPGVAAARPAGSVMVDTHILIVDGRPAIAVTPHGEGMNLLGLRADLGAEFVQEGEIGDLPWPYDDAEGPVPPFGRMFGAPVFIDPSVIASNDIEFGVFGSTDFIEMPYDEFARLEQPRVAELVAAGELPPPPLH
jgi:prolyl-tRNA editing enzyme YbaK/EbsC (Cys-tRNA(Pro) deacylase)